MIAPLLGAIASSQVASAAPPFPATPTLRIDSFATAGTWTAPAAYWGLTGTYKRARVECWAPGGGGTANVGGGGGGAYARANDLDLSGASTYAVAGVAPAAANANGGDATFGSVLVVADGGLSGANGGVGGKAANSTGDVKFDGGAGLVQAGNTNGGAGAGSGGAASGSTPGFPDGGGGGTTQLIGRPLGQGGGATTVAGMAGGRGRVQVAYQVAGTPGFPRFRGYTQARNSGTTVSPGLPAGTVVGDLLIAAVTVDGTSSAQTLAGWNSLGSQIVDGTGAPGGTAVMRLQVYSRIATGTGDAPALPTGLSSRAMGWCWRFQGASAAEATFSVGSSSAAAPPPHTSSVGAVNGLWMPIVAYNADTGGTPDATAGPANYHTWIFAGAVATNGVAMASACRELAAATEAPGVFAGTIVEKWIAATVLIRP